MDQFYTNKKRILKYLPIFYVQMLMYWIKIHVFIGFIDVP